MTASPVAADAAPRRFAALHVADYRRYFVLGLMAMMADNIEHVISYWVIFLTFHSPALAGFAVISHWVPFLLFSVWAGALADRHDCRRLMQIGQALFMVASAAWALLFMTDTLRVWHAVVLLTLHGFAGVIIAPASQLVLHDMVGRVDLHSAIRLNATSRHLAILLGPAVGGALLLLLGPAWGLLANVLIYVPFTVLLVRMPYTGHRTSGVSRIDPRGVGLFATVRVVAEARHDPRIVTMLLLAGVSSFFVGSAFQAQMPEYAHHFGTGHARVWYSVLLAANAAGAVLGAILLETARVLRPSPRVAIVCAIAWSATLGLFPWAPGYGAAVTLLVLAGGFNIAFTSMAQTLVQMLAPAEARGRIVGLFNTAMLGLRAGSGFTVGVVGAAIGVHWSLSLSAAVVVVIATALLASRRAAHAASH